ncbi:MAG: TonB-dependent receptor [Candidatus Aminicenantes bacterium]|nr:TonB-dependent receptor [Candidatus Aminicenantes bacterium]
MKRKFLIFLTLFVFTVVAAETGQIKGIVFDKNGNPLAGVAVTATGPSLQGKRTSFSLKDGSFVLPFLPPGKYTVTFHLQGFSPVIIKNVRVYVGRSTFLKAEMEAVALEEEVIVEEKAPPLEKLSSDISYQISSDELEVLPSSGRDPVDVTKFIPGVVGVRTSTRRGRGRGLPSFRGEGEEGNNWLVDGLSVRGVRLANEGIAVNYDAIDEIQIISDPFSPELASAFGGVINIVTKTGGDEFHGEAGLLFTDKALQADKLSQLSISFEPESFSRYNGYFNVGGPIIKQKLWFFISNDAFYNLDETREGYIDYLYVPSGKRTNVLDSLFTKLSFSPLENHTISLSAMYKRLLHQSGGIGVPETYRKDELSERLFILSYKGVISPTTFIEASGGNSYKRTFFEPESGDLNLAMYFIEDIAQNIHNVLGRTEDMEKRTNLAIRFTHIVPSKRFGTHELGFGFEYFKESSDFRVDFSGRAEDPFPGNGFDNGTKYSFKSWQEGKRTPSLLWEYGPFAFVNSTSGIGVYLRDKFTFRRLTFMIGLRSYTQHNYNSQGKEMWSWGLSDFLSPRIFATFDLTGNGNNILKAGWGIFKDISPTMHLGFFNPQAPIHFRRYLWKGPENPTDEELHNPENWEFLNEQKQGPYEINPNLKPNSLKRYLLEYDKVFFKNWVFKIRYVRTEAKNLLELVGYFDPNPPYYKFVFENFKFKRRDYNGLEFELQGSAGKFLILNASYTYSSAKGTNPGQVEMGSWGEEEGGTYYVTLFGKHIFVPPLPELLPVKQLIDWGFGGLGGPEYGDEGWYGKLPYSVDHHIKINAIMFTPYGLVFSISGEWLSGYHWEKRGLVPFFGYYAFPEGRGSRTTPSILYLDAGIEKEFPLGAGVFLSIRADVFNILNSQRPVSYVRIDTPSFGEVWGRQQPRQARLSIRIRW